MLGIQFCVNTWMKIVLLCKLLGDYIFLGYNIFCLHYGSFVQGKMSLIDNIRILKKWNFVFPKKKSYFPWTRQLCIYTDWLISLCNKNNECYLLIEEQFFTNSRLSFFLHIAETFSKTIEIRHISTLLFKTILKTILKICTSNWDYIWSLWWMNMYFS